jgi:hypothetical protein
MSYVKHQRLTENAFHEVAALQPNPDWVPNPTLLHFDASAATPLPCFCYAIALQK